MGSIEFCKLNLAFEGDLRGGSVKVIGFGCFRGFNSFSAGGGWTIRLKMTFGKFSVDIQFSRGTATFVSNQKYVLLFASRN